MNSSTIASKHGYEIVSLGDQIIFADRRLFWVGLASWLTFGLGFLLLLNGLLLPLMIYQKEHRFFPALLLPVLLGLLMTAVGTHFTRQWRTRKQSELLAVPNQLRLDLVTGTLSLHAQPIAQQSSVSISTSISLLDGRGMMRLILLHWPTGTRTIFRSNVQSEVEGVLTQLNALGLGKS